jgi:hypothetical protein
MVAVSNELVPSQKDCTAVSLIFCAIVYKEKKIVSPATRISLVLHVNSPVKPPLYW